MRKHARWAHSSVSAILSGGPSQDLGVRNRSGVAVGSGEEDGGWRWGSRSKKGKSLQDNPLMSAFTKLRSELRGCRGMFYPLFGGGGCEFWIMLIIDVV
jgi:brefeldin A-resistance guanine nucleotide exchange factor 1